MIGAMTEVLDYATPPQSRRLARRCLAWALAAAVVGFVYWLRADWWAYVQSDDGSAPWPLFKVPWWFQIGESLVIGLAVTVPLPE